MNLFSDQKTEEEMGFKPPGSLREETQKWVDGLIETYDLKSHHLKLLAAAAQAWDEYRAAREFLAEKGTTYADRFAQPCSRPEVQIMRDSRLAFVRIVRELNLPGQDIPGTDALGG